MANAVQVAEWAYAAGIRDWGNLITAVQVAYAESGFNQNAEGDRALQDSKWGPSIGLWQIRSLKSETGKGTTRDASKLKDPQFNARSMVAISGGGRNWEPWSVTSPRDPIGYPRFLLGHPIATTAVATFKARVGAGNIADEVQEKVEGPIDAVRDLAGVVSDAVQAPVQVIRWLTQPGTWIRIAYGVGGVALLVAGLRIVAQPVVDGAVDVAGKVAKVAVTKGKK